MSLISTAVAGPAAVSERTFSFNDSFRDTLLDHAFSEIGDPGSEFDFESIDADPRSVWQFPEGTGLRLDQGMPEFPDNVYTIFLQVRLANTGGYRKMIDFRDGNSDSGLYLLSGELIFFPDSTREDAVAIGDDVWGRIALTRDATGLVVGYLNGARVFSFDDSVDGIADGTGQILRFFVDDTGTTGEESGGAVACVRFFDEALDAATVGTLACPYRIGLNDTACRFDALGTAIANAASGDRLVLSAGDEYLGRNVVAGKILDLVGARPEDDCAPSFAPGSVSLRNPLAIIGRGGVLELRDGADVSLDAQFVLDVGAAGAGGLVYAAPGTRLRTFYTTFRGGLVDEIFTDPVTEPDGPRGGCIIADGASLILSNSFFENCNAGTGNGGGVALVGGSSAVVNGFSNYNLNQADGQGGAIYVGPGSSLAINGDLMTFANNTADIGGAIAVEEGLLTMDPSEQPFLPPVFQGNVATTTGGAISIAGRPRPPAAGPNSIAGAQFSANSAGQFGGAITANGADVDMIDLTVVDNSANQGGGLYLQNGTYTLTQSDYCRPFLSDGATVHSSRLANNLAPLGAALIAVNSVGQTLVTVDGAVIANNGSGPPDATVLSSGAFLSLANTWITGASGPAIELNSGAEASIAHATIESNATGLLLRDGTSGFVDVSIIHGNGAGIVVEGNSGAAFSGPEGCNIDQTGLVGPAIDPQFVTTELGPVHLPRTSPAVDNCFNAMPSVGPLDLDGLPRIQGASRDFGAFEYRVVLFTDGFE